jgi:fatty acid desaturase
MFRGAQAPEPRRARRRIVAWPTLLLATSAFVVWAAQLWLGANDIWPVWVVAGNTACAYAMYITVHDATHGAVAKARWINDWLGRVGILVLTPLIAFAPYRYLHLQHHNESLGGRWRRARRTPLAPQGTPSTVPSRRLSAAP